MLLLLLVAPLLVARYACTQHLLLLLLVGVWLLLWVWCKAARGRSLLLLWLLVVWQALLVVACHHAMLPRGLEGCLQTAGRGVEQPRCVWSPLACLEGKAAHLQHCAVEAHRLCNPVTILRVEGSSLHARLFVCKTC